MKVRKHLLNEKNIINDNMFLHNILKCTSLRLSKRSAQVNLGATGTVTLNFIVCADVEVLQKLRPKTIAREQQMTSMSVITTKRGRKMGYPNSC